MNFIFDFDGTIVDSLPAFIEVFNKTVRGNDNPLTKTEIEDLRDMPSRKAVNKLGVRWWQIPRLLVLGMADFRALLPTLHSFTGLPKVIRELHDRGDKLFIVTSNTRESVELFLAQHQIEHYFTDLATGAGLFRKAKYIRRIVREHGLKRSQTVYVGDETRDIQAARLAMVRTVSVTWGFNTRRILKKQRPAFLIDDPNELLTITSVALKKP